MLSLALASSLKQSSQTRSPRVAFNPERDFIPACRLSYYLNLLPMIKVQEISHKYLDVWLLLRARRWSSMGLPAAHVSNLPKPEEQLAPVGTELLFLKASQSPLLAVSHPAHSFQLTGSLACGARLRSWHLASNGPNSFFLEGGSTQD